MDNLNMNANAQFTDQDIMQDLLTSQKNITSGYNTFANECATPDLKNDFVNILSDEHNIQHDLFCEMQKRGWYQTTAAEQNKINQAKQKYSGTAQ